jgi:hypothetical protein
VGGIMSTILVPLEDTTHTCVEGYRSDGAP